MVYISSLLQVAGVVLLEENKHTQCEEDFGWDPQHPAPTPPPLHPPLPECESASEGTWERRRRCTKRCFCPPPSSSCMWWALHSSLLPTGNNSLNTLPVFIMACRSASAVLQLQDPPPPSTVIQSCLSCTANVSKLAWIAFKHLRVHSLAA